MTKTYKIVKVDNFDRGWIKPVIVAETDKAVFAVRIARLLNKAEEEENDTVVNYYLVKDGDYQVD